jgi:hypothetical protein
MIVQTIMLLVLTSLGGEAGAFWGHDSKGSESGLDFASGYDVNTVARLSGKVTAPPEKKGESDQARMIIATATGTVEVLLGPWWYWERQKTVLGANAEVVVTGSKAVGKDGKAYLFAQQLESGMNGERIMLRNDAGEPLWSRSGAGNSDGSRMHNGAGAGNRGHGMRGGRR